MRRTAVLFAFVPAGMLLVTGVAFAKVISCSIGAAECDGTNRADTMHGTTSADKMLGNDAVKGTVDDDTIFGGPGEDIVRGGTHSVTNDGSVDVLRCGPGRD